MKVWGALLCLMLLASGCTATGQVTGKPDVMTHVKNTAPVLNQSNHTPTSFPPKAVPENSTSTSKTQSEKKTEPDPCDQVICEDSTVYCPDGYMADCPNFCYGNGTCTKCSPDCSGHGLKHEPAGAPDNQPGANISITRLNYDAPGDDRKRENWNGEWAEITNTGSAPAALAGWTLSDASGHEFVFPEFELRPGTSVKVHSGDGDGNSTDLFWNTGRRPIWNNGGDTATLKDSNAETVSKYSY